MDEGAQLAGLADLECAGGEFPSYKTEPIAQDVVARFERLARGPFRARRRLPATIVEPSEQVLRRRGRGRHDLNTKVAEVGGFDRRELCLHLAERSDEGRGCSDGAARKTETRDDSEG